MIALASATPSAAQDARVLAFLKQVNDQQQPPSMEALAAGGLEAAGRAAAQGTCMHQSVEVSNVRPITGDRLVLQGVAQRSLQNGWRFDGVLVGCPSGARADFIVIRDAAGQLQMHLTNLGQSLVSYSVGQDSVSKAILMSDILLAKAGAACEAGLERPLDSRVTQKSNDLGPETYGVRYRGGWTEIWTLRRCNREIEVEMMFSGDGDGGAYINVSQAGSRLK
mgnify:FL=1